MAEFVKLMSIFSIDIKNTVLIMTAQRKFSCHNYIGEYGTFLLLMNMVI